MTSAVVLAGYGKSRAVAAYAKLVERHYGESFIETGYKPLRRFEAIEDGTAVAKPLIQFVLERLLASTEISDIVIVGHAPLLERALRGVIARFDKPCTIISQSAKLSADVIERFGIAPKKVRHDTIAGNAVKGYAASLACERRRQALFVASDSPFTTHAFIDSVVRIGRTYGGDHAIVVPAALLEGERDRFGRFPLKLVNDTGILASAATDAHGRQGFRPSSLLLANPFEFDMNSVNTAYSLRKGLSPSVQLKLFRITRALGYANIYSKYFIRRDLSISEVEKIASSFFEGKVKIVPVRGMESSYDYDGTDRERRGIDEMLRGDGPKV
jgi:hypothetical protein